MNQYVRHIFFGLLFLLLLGVEKNTGLPIFTFTTLIIWLSSFSLPLKLLGQVITSSMIAVTFVIPFSLAFALVFGLLLSLEHQGKNFFHHSTRFFLTVVAANAVIAVYTHWLPTIPGMVYHVCTLIGLLFFTRYWLSHRSPSHVLRMSPTIL